MGRSGLIHPESPVLTVAESCGQDTLSRVEHGFTEGTPPPHLGCMTGSDRGGHQLQVSYAENLISQELSISGGFFACLLLLFQSTEPFGIHRYTRNAVSG